MEQAELWLTPLILLPGVALLIMSTSVRFQQVHDEFHHLLDHPEDSGHILARQLLQRAILFRDALVCLYISVGCFALGSFLGGLVNFLAPQFLWVVGGLALLGIFNLVFASWQLVRESLLCLRIIRAHSHRLETLPEEPAET